MKKCLVVVFTCILVALIALASVSCDKALTTETIAFNKKDARVIAHRGLSGLEVENTDSAFIRAGEHTYYGIETDVRRTADGKFVISHDDTLARLSGQNIAVESSTLDELKNIPLYDKNSQELGEERVTDLDSYIEICKQYNKQAILELKSSFTQEEIVRMIEIINSHDYINGVTFISFGYDNLLYVRNALPNHSVQYLFSELNDEIENRLINDRIDVAINHNALTKRALDKFHDAGLKVNCWTVDDKATAEKLARWGVDYITTNILE